MESAEGQAIVPPTAPVQCHLLGTCVLTIGDTRVLPDQELLFGYALHMAVHAGTGLHRDRVAKLIWPGHDVEASRHSLRQLTYRLRGLGMPLQSRGPSILLAADAVQLDYAPLVVARPVPANILAHPRLDLMPGYAPAFSTAFSRWLEDFRAGVSLGLRSGLMACISDARSRGRYRDVETFARQCLAIDPLNEEATLGLAEATVLQGNKSLAMRMLHDYEREVGEPEGSLQLQSTLLRRRIAERHNIYNVLSDEVEMLGRDEELELLVRLKHLAKGGARQTVLLTGEAGIGKTRLATEFSKIALLQGMSLAKLDCQSGWESQPLTGATELAQALLGLPGALGCAPEAMATVKTLTSAVVPEPSLSLAMGDADAILAGVRWAVFDLCEAVSQERPLLLVVDNLHWIDDLSASFLEFIQRRGIRRRIMVIYTSRDAPSENRRDALTPLMATEYHVPMVLLGDTEALRLVQRLADITDRPLKPNEAEECVRRAGGNPYFLWELARFSLIEGITDEVPVSLKQVVDWRVRRLSRLGRRTLEACVSLGALSTVPRLRQVLRLSSLSITDAADELDATSLATLKGGVLLPRHDVVRELVRAHAPTNTSRLIATRVVRLLAREIAQTHDALALQNLGGLLVHADGSRQIFAVTLRLARRLLKLGAAHDALTFARLLASSAENESLRTKCSLLEAMCCRALGDWVGVLRATVTCAENNGLLHDPAELLRLEAEYQLGKSDSKSLARLVSCAADEAAPPRHRAEAASLGMIIADNSFDIHAAEEISNHLSKLRVSHPAQRLAIETAQMIFYTQARDYACAARAATNMVTMAMELGIASEYTKALRRAANCYWRSGNISRARELVSMALVESEKLNQPHDRLNALSLLAGLDLQESRYPAFRTNAALLTEQLHAFSADSVHALHVNYLCTLMALESNDKTLLPSAVRSPEGADPFLGVPMARQMLIGVEIGRVVLSAAARIPEDLMAEGLRLLQASAGKSMQDFYVTTVARGLIAAGRSDEAKQLVVEYLRRRSDLFAPLNSLFSAAEAGTH